MPQVSLPNCKKCDVKLDESNSVYTRTGRLNTCKSCYNIYKRENSKYNPEWHRSYGLHKRYGVNQDDLKKRLELQLNGCAICKQPFEKFAVDHDHRTGRTRDLLCYRCNNILGLANDNEELLFMCIEYLKRHEAKVS